MRTNTRWPPYMCSLSAKRRLQCGSGGWFDCFDRSSRLSSTYLLVRYLWQAEAQPAILNKHSRFPRVTSVALTSAQSPASPGRNALDLTSVLYSTHLYWQAKYVYTWSITVHGAKSSRELSGKPCAADVNRRFVWTFDWVMFKYVKLGFRWSCMFNHTVDDWISVEGQNLWAKTQRSKKDEVMTKEHDHWFGYNTKHRGKSFHPIFWRPLRAKYCVV